MAQRRFLSVLAVSAAAAALAGGIPAIASAVTAGAEGSTGVTGLTSAQVARLSQNADKPVIVILKSQAAQAPVSSSAAVDAYQAVHPGQLARCHGVVARGAAFRGRPGGRGGDPGHHVHHHRPDGHAARDDRAHGGRELRAQHLASAAQHSRRLRDEQEQGPDRAGRPRADRHQDGTLAGLHRGRRQGGVHRRRPRPEERELPAEERHLGLHRLQGLHRGRPDRADHCRRGVPRREHHRRPGHQRLQRQRLLRSGLPGRLLHQDPGRGPRRLPRRP